MKGIITAGGRGSRLFPMTRSIPKELIPFCGIPVIEYCVNFLKENGIPDIIVIIGHNKDPIINYLGNGELFGVHVAYVIQESPEGLGHSVLTVEHYIDSDTFVVLLGDTILDNINLKEMIHNHKHYNVSVTILLEHITERPERYGVVQLYNDRIISIIEKPISKENQESYKVNNGWYAIAGLYIFNKNIFDYIRKTKKDINKEIQLTDAIKLVINSKDIVLGHILKGKRIDIGSWEYIKEEKEFYKNMTDEGIQSIIDSREMTIDKNDEKGLCGMNTKEIREKQKRIK